MRGTILIVERNADVEHMGGLRTFAPDGNPVIEWDEDVPNFYGPQVKAAMEFRQAPHGGYVAAMIQDALAG